MGLLLAVAPAARARLMCMPASQDAHLELVQVRATTTPYRLAVFARGDPMSWMVKVTGQWEIRSPMDLARAAGIALPHHGVFLDIGASFGYHSVLFAKHGFQVIAVEPLLKNQLALFANLCMNAELLGVVKPVHVGVTSARAVPANMSCTIPEGAVSRTQDARMQCSSAPWTCSNYNRMRSNAKLRCTDLEVTTVDHVLRRVGPRTVDVVRISSSDPGKECDILEGAQGLFHRYRPRLVLWSARYDNVTSCFSRLAEAHGYRTASLDNSDSRRQRPVQGAQYSRVLYLTDDDLEGVPRRGGS